MASGSPAVSRPQRPSQTAGLMGGPAVAAAVMLLADLVPGDPAPTRMAAVALWMAIWWITEAIPLSATALLPVVLFPVLGLMPGAVVGRQYFNDVILLFLGGFLVAIAMERWQLHRRLALNILARCGNRPAAILAGFMGATAFLSMWISNTATAMMMVPIALAVLLHTEAHGGADGGPAGTEGARSPMGPALMLGIAYGASIGGIATLVGTPPNLALTAVYTKQFPDETPLSFARWFLFGVPLAMVLLVLSWLLLRTMYLRGCAGLGATGAVLREELRSLGRMSYEQGAVFVVFCTVAFAWLTRSDLVLGEITLPGWSRLFPEPRFLTDGTVAIGAALVLFLLPSRTAASPHRHLLDRGAIAQLPWNIVLLFGGGFALAAGFEETGLSAWVGDRLAMLGNLPPILLVLAICLVVTFLTELTSNTATANILLPVLAANAVALDLHPLLLMVPGTLCCSMAFMLPVATPPNAIVFGTDRVTMSDMARTGLVLNIVGVLVATAAVIWLGPALLGIEMK